MTLSGPGFCWLIFAVASVRLQSGESSGGKTNKTPRKGCICYGTGGEGGIRTLGRLLTYTRFPGVRLKPLIHPSVYCWTTHRPSTQTEGRDDSRVHCFRQIRSGHFLANASHRNVNNCRENSTSNVAIMPKCTGHMPIHGEILPCEVQASNILSR